MNNREIVNKYNELQKEQQEIIKNFDIQTFFKSEFEPIFEKYPNLENIYFSTSRESDDEGGSYLNVPCDGESITLNFIDGTTSDDDEPENESVCEIIQEQVSGIVSEVQDEDLIGPYGDDFSFSRN